MELIALEKVTLELDYNKKSFRFWCKARSFSLPVFPSRKLTSKGHLKMETTVFRIQFLSPEQIGD